MVVPWWSSPTLGLATGDKTSADFGCGSTFYMALNAGGITRRLTSYSTAANDVWSLGVILVNLICWSQPMEASLPADDTFREYLRTPDFLKEILPISRVVNSILKRVLHLPRRGSMHHLGSSQDGPQRRQLTATSAEIKARQEAARQAAAEAHPPRQAEKAAAAAAYRNNNASSRLPSKLHALLMLRPTPSCRGCPSRRRRPQARVCPCSLPASGRHLRPDP